MEITKNYSKPVFHHIFLGEVKYDDKLTEEDGVYVQAAILFTSCSGQRRLRVINLALNTGTSMAEMYRNCKYLPFEKFTRKSISRKKYQFLQVNLIQ